MATDPAAPERELDPAIIRLIDALARAQAREDHEREMQEAAECHRAKRRGDPK